MPLGGPKMLEETTPRDFRFSPPKPAPEPRPPFKHPWPKKVWWFRLEIPTLPASWDYYQSEQEDDYESEKEAQEDERCNKPSILWRRNDGVTLLQLAATDRRGVWKTCSEPDDLAGWPEPVYIKAASILDACRRGVALLLKRAEEINLKNRRAFVRTMRSATVDNCFELLGILQEEIEGDRLLDTIEAAKEMLKELTK